MNYDAIVIGAGPAGASAALALAQQGKRVAIIEKAAFPRRKVCGEFISATSIAVLDRLGVGGTWRAEAGPEIRRVALFAGERCIAASMPAAANGGFGRALSRHLLDGFLLDAAQRAGAKVFQPWQAVEIIPEAQASAVRIRARDDETLLRAPVIIAAHGSWEPGKLPSQLAKSSRSSDLLGFKAHFMGSLLDADLMPLLVFPGGYGGMVCADHGRLSISCCIRRDTLVKIRRFYGNAPAADAVHRHLIASCRGIEEAIGAARLDGPWMAAGPIRPGIRPYYADDIFRVGNIAGESHPIIAEGISMAMQSSWLLATELGRIDGNDRAARETAGRRYSAAWRGQFWTRIHAAAAFAAVVLGPMNATLVGSVVSHLPGILTLGARLSGKAKDLPGLGTSQRAAAGG